LDALLSPAERASAANNPFVRASVDRLGDLIGSGSAEGASFQQTMEEQAYFEVFCRLLLPDTPFGSSINDYKDLKDNVLFVRPAVTDVVSYLDHITLSSDEYVTAISGEKVYGRGLGFASLRRARAAIWKYIKMGGGDVSLLLDDRIEVIITAAERASSSKGATSFPMTQLPMMFDTIFNSRHITWPFLLSVQIWAIFLFMIALMRRPSNVCKYCASMEHFRLPDNPQHWTKTGFPRRLLIGFQHSKTNHELQYYALHYNPICAMFCPVFFLLLWLNMSGIIFEKQGPLFRPLWGKKGSYYVPTADRKRRIDNSNATYDDIWEAEVWDENEQGYVYKCVHWPETTLKDHMHIVWDVTAAEKRITPLHLATPMSFRKMSVKWAARCLGVESQIKKNAGHSKHSTSFYEYIEAGCQERNEALGAGEDGEEDPVLSIWCWKPAAISVIDPDMDAVFAEAGVESE